MIAYDTSGKSYSLTETNLGGGEGKLYAVDNNPELYAKILNQKSVPREEKQKFLNGKICLQKMI